MKRTGFTIVELLIVIVIIAILAAITIVTYRGIQDRTLENSMRSDFASVGKKFSLLRVDTSTWPANTDSGLLQTNVNVSQSIYDSTNANLLYCGSNTSANYAIVAKSKNGKTYVSGSALPFQEYANPNNYVLYSDYVSICTEINGVSSARYGYTQSDGWRAWTRNP